MVNWRVISMTSDDDSENTLAKERAKIAGDKGGAMNWSDDTAKADGMSGCGRNYSIRMGVTRVHTTTLPSNGTRFTTVNIQKGQTIDFTIKAGIIDKVYGDDLTGSQ